MKAVTLSIATVALSLLVAGTLQTGTTYRVGSGCPYGTIQAAINDIPDQGDGIIRIRSGTYVENLDINNKTVDLLGGHNDCTTTDANGFTLIDASGNASPVITYRVNLGPAGTSHVLFTDQLDLFNGTGSGIAYGGGISVHTSADYSATVILNRTSVHDNQTAYVGGGIALRGDGGGTLALQDNSRIYNNTATGSTPDGGGLYCQGNYSITMIGGSIHDNTAGESGDNHAHGGGIYLDGCDLSWFAQNQLTLTDDAALRNNTVYGGIFGGGGGGLYAAGGAQVNLIGAHFTFDPNPPSTRPLRIHNNRARGQNSIGVDNGSGSAVYAKGSGTRVRLDRTWVYENDANGSGTFTVDGGAEIIVERGSEVCHHPRNCSRVFDNSARVTAVAYSYGDDSAIRFRRTIVSGNFTDAGNAEVFLSRAGGIVEVDNSLVFGNSSSRGFQIYEDFDDNTTLHVRRSTVADNEFTDTVFRLRGDTVTLHLRDSIIHEPGIGMALISSGVPNFSIDCVVWHHDQLPSTRTLVADPLFADPDNDLFYLQPGSPAINYCDVPPPAPGVDLDWNPRGELHSGQPAVYGPYDLGAYELPIAIFSDRFETSP